MSSFLDLFGANLFFDTEDFGKLALRLLLNLGVMFVTVRLLYYPLYRRRDYVFIYFLFNLVTFFLCFLLRKVPIELGFALGLFAVFGILRYRTEPIRIRDLTYLFVVIGIGIWNAVSNKKISVSELMLVNGTTVAVIYVLERASFGGWEEEGQVLYDKLELLRPERRPELLQDLGQRTGFDVHRVSVGQIDLLRDSAQLTIFYGRKKEDNGRAI